MHENELELHRKIIMSVEANFHLEGYVNKQAVAFRARKTYKYLLKSISILNV